jgi:LytS/YehU family sensor histidine kinase
MIMQPLIENAVKYGVYENTQESLIEITCTCNTSALSISIRNEFDPDYSYKKGEGIGLKNIRSRLRIIYNSEDLILITKDHHIFEVKVLFPQL